MLTYCPRLPGFLRFPKTVVFYFIYGRPICISRTVGYLYLVKSVLLVLNLLYSQYLGEKILYLKKYLLEKMKIRIFLGKS